MRNKILILFALIWLSSCKTPNELIAPYMYPYQKFVELKTSKGKFKNCKELKESKVNFYFKHANMEELKGLKLKIEVGGVFYESVFCDKVTLTNFQYCADSNLTKTGSINIHVADENRGVAYLWSKKASFNLNEIKNVHIELLSKDHGEDSYKIKINNSLTYN